MTPTSAIESTGSDNRKAGLALILGSIGGILTMAIHPTMETAHMAVLAPVAHSLAIVSVLVLFLGACGLAQVLAARDRIAFAALATYALALVAVLMATTISGFVMPGILRLMQRDVPAAAVQWRIAMAAIFQINQACSRIDSVAAAAAITLWSIAALRTHRLSRGLAILGCISAPLVALLIAVGHLRLDVHGMTAVMLTEVIWFAGMGVSLRRLL